MRVDQRCSGVGDLPGLRTNVAPTKIDTIAREPTVTVMKADSHLQLIHPPYVCHRCQERFRPSCARVTWRSLQTDRARIMCGQKEHANTTARWGLHNGG